MTESAYFATASQGECYKDLDVENYEVIETLDSHTCSFCGEMDGKVFPINKMQAGSTAPPFHPWCRGTTAPYYEDMKGVGQRFARDKDGKTYTVPSDMTYAEWKQNFVDNSAESGIIKTKEVKSMSINAIELPIEQRNTGKGNPNAVLIFDVDLNNRQIHLLERLPEFNSVCVVKKKEVNMTDLAALTAKTGDEFAMFTKENDRLVVRGNKRCVDIDTEKAINLAESGYKWSGHTHPGVDFLCMQPSDGDYAILDCFKQKNAVIYNSKGDFRTFEKRS